jgi:hypothetical protein
VGRGEPHRGRGELRLARGRGGGGEGRGFVDPITVWPTSEASPSGAEILVDGAIPQWEGDLFVTALRGESLWRLELDDRGTVTDRERLLEGEVGRVRDVAQAPDGSLWVSTSNRDGRGRPQRTTTASSGSPPRGLRSAGRRLHGGGHGALAAGMRGSGPKAWIWSRLSSASRGGW